MFDGQHDNQACVGSSVLPCKPARMRVALSATAGVLSALAPLLMKETVLSLSEFRQAPERQELAHMPTGPMVTCPELEAADLDFELPFICGFGTGLLVALAHNVILRCLCSSRVVTVTLRVH